jgi:hypothetical protein
MIPGDRVGAESPCHGLAGLSSGGVNCR